MGYCTWAGMNEANQIYHDTEWGIPYWYFPLFYARVVKFGKGTAFHKASIPVSCSRQRVRAGNAWPGDAGWRKPFAGSTPAEDILTNIDPLFFYFVFFSLLNTLIPQQVTMSIRIPAAVLTQMLSVRTSSGASREIGINCRM